DVLVLIEKLILIVEPQLILILKLKLLVGTFFIYNETDDEKARYMSFEEIKKIGTDCGGYAYLYERLSESLGFEATTRKWEGLEGVFPGHRWAVIWDDQHYCRIDMLYVNCYEIERENNLLSLNSRENLKIKKI
ncbi:unnamed protein product, partial [marine sediment metagenome]